MQKLVKTDCDIFYISYGPSLQLVKHEFPKVNCIDIGGLSLFETVRKISESVDNISGFIDLQKNSRSIAVKYLLRLKHRFTFFSYRKHSFDKRLAVLKARTAKRISNSEIDWPNLPTVKLLMQNSFLECIETLSLSQNEAAQTQASENNPSTTIAIAAGASHQVKTIPAEIVFEIISSLSTQISGLKVILLGDKNDKTLNDIIETQLKETVEVLNLTGAISLDKIPELLASVKCLISSDSAILHLANFHGIHSVSLFGPTIESLGYGTSSKLNTPFSSPISCRPCSRNGDKDCRFDDKKCFSGIDKEEVVKRILAYT
ncbi:MAG: hypothetical protein JKY53_03670 [Flavobacteriales bacterium]|nr:hypothetical protein [Flavobacteriales bacterium]